MRRALSTPPMTALLLLAAMPLTAQRVELMLTCRPEFAVADQRPERPSDVRAHTPLATYYLFDNPQLFDLRVSLVNIGPDRLPVEAPSGDWARGLKVRLSRDGVELRPGAFSIEPARRLRRALVYYKDGAPITDPQFRRQVTSPAAQPVMPYDDYDWTEQAVDALPRELAPYEEAVVVLRLRAPGGSDLPLGLYTLSIADPANHTQCDRDLLMVMRPPASSLDVVDAHVVRATAYQAEGNLDSAADELARATELAPNVLKGWVYRATLAAARNDLDDQAEAAIRIEELLAQKSESSPKEFVGIVRDAQLVAKAAPDLRRRAAAANGATP